MFMKLARAVFPGLLLLAVTSSGAQLTRAEDKPKPVFKTERFDRDPGWEGRNNRTLPANVDAVTQDFGYTSKTHFAGKEAGEVGGSVTRTTKPAWYADRIAPKTLKDKLSASGPLRPVLDAPRRQPGQDLV
jgi:hypothetical protein